MMGCDIHMYKEKFSCGHWQTADTWVEDEDGRREVTFHLRYTSRNYELFGLLCKGVRREHSISFLERGMPFDASEEVRAACAEWDDDGHSHSYLYLHELKAVRECIRKECISVSGVKDRLGLEVLMESIKSGNPDWNLLFPYASYSSSKDYVEFSVNVPMDFYFGGELDEIINSFSDVDGENHRIVFWFDN